MGFVWPWKRHKKVNEVPDEMAAAEHAASLAEGTDAGGPKRRLELRYTGKVQAVGFRFQAQLLTQSVGVTGWVKNLDDRDVLLDVQGTDGQLRAYQKGIDDLSQSRNTWIDARLVSSQDVPCVQERDFRVQY